MATWFCCLLVCVYPPCFQESDWDLGSRSGKYLVFHCHLFPGWDSFLPHYTAQHWIKCDHAEKAEISTKLCLNCWRSMITLTWLCSWAEFKSLLFGWKPTLHVAAKCFSAWHMTRGSSFLQIIFHLQNRGIIRKIKVFDDLENSSLISVDICIRILMQTDHWREPLLTRRLIWNICPSL